MQSNFEVVFVFGIGGVVLSFYCLKGQEVELS